jgi:type IV secretion system protein VirB5
MTQPFNTETKNYASKRPAETPYQRVKKIWDQRLGSSLIQAKNWRLIAFINGLVALILLLLLIGVIATSHRNRVFIAEVTGSGQIRNVALLQTTYQPSSAQKEYFVTQFIEMIRSVPLDPVAAKKEWTNAYDFLTQRAAKKLNQQWQKNNPIDLLGKQTVTVTIKSIDPISKNTFNVTWNETKVSSDGLNPLTTSYSGVFTTALIQPTLQQQIIKNPLGIYIVDFNFSPQQGK